MPKTKLHLYHGKWLTTKQLQQIALSKYNNQITTRLINKRLQTTKWSLGKILKTPSLQSKCKQQTYYYHAKPITVQQIKQLYKHSPDDELTCLMIAILIKENLVKSKLSYTKIGKAINTSANRISKYANGKRTPNAVTLIKLARILDIDLNQLKGPTL